MLTIGKEQMDEIARARFVERLESSFSRDIPSFAKCTREDRHGFISEAVALAEFIGLKTEQGLASYALAIWWLGVDFEKKSEELESLLHSSLPEVRKIHAMNEWVSAMIGDPEDVSGADRVLRQALSKTKAWGTSE